MRKPIVFSLGAAVALALVVQSGIVSAAPSKPGSGRAIWNRTQAPFNDSNEFTGTLRGELLLGTTTYQIAPNVAIYEVGVGRVPVGTSYANRRIFVSGVRKGEVGVIRSIVVQPLDDANSTERKVRVGTNADPQ